MTNGMSGARVKFAQPTDTNYLGNQRITALEARKLFFSNPQQITDKHNFICGDNNCQAPITCRGIDSNSVSPAFVDGVTKKNMHTCRLKNINMRDSVTNVDDDVPHTQYETSQIIIVDPFIESTQSKGEKGSFQSTIFPGSRKERHKHEGVGQSLTQKRSIHLNKLPDIVKKFRVNRDENVYHRSGGSINNFKVSDLFVPIEHSLTAKQLFINAPIIFYGNGIISKLKNKNDVFLIRFVNITSRQTFGIFIFSSNLRKLMPNYEKCLNSHEIVQIYTRIRPIINPKNNKYANIELQGKTPIEEYLVLKFIDD